MISLPSLVYLLCFATSVACLILLVRSYMKSRTQLLLWAALCFVGLALNNALLFIDVVVFPTEISLQHWRHATAIGAVLVLLYGFIYESD
jgi:hypothetical protein